MAKQFEKPSFVPLQARGGVGIGDAIRQHLEAFGLEKRVNETRVINQWESIMGSTVANRTLGLELLDGVLKVRLSSGPLRQNLQMSKKKILSLIEQKCGAGVVSDIEFR